MPIDAKQPYDDNNIFARILRGEIAVQEGHGGRHGLAFHDINPLAPIHVLVIPKGVLRRLGRFFAKASDAEIVDFTRAIGAVARSRAMRPRSYPGACEHRPDGPGSAAPPRPRLRRPPLGPMLAR